MFFLIFSAPLRGGSFLEKSLEKSTCTVMIIIIVIFGNQIFLELIWLQILKIWSKFQKMWVCKQLHKWRESFSPNTDNFWAFFILFNGEEFWKVQWINRKWYVTQNYAIVFFLWTFRTSRCISPTIFKIPTI